MLINLLTYLLPTSNVMYFKMSTGFHSSSRIFDLYLHPPAPGYATDLSIGKRLATSSKCVHEGWWRCTV